MKKLPYLIAFPVLAFVALILARVGQRGYDTFYKIPTNRK